MHVLGSPAQLGRRSTTQNYASDPLVQSTGLSSPFAPGSAFSLSPSPKSVLDSPVSVRERVTYTPPTSTPPWSRAPPSQNVTPDCPPPVNLGADSVPRFPTPHYAADSPSVFPHAIPLPAPLMHETPLRNSTDKGGSGILGRLRSKSRSGRDAKPTDTKRERRFSISDRLNSVLKRKQKQEMESPPPLPVRSGVSTGVTASASTTVINDKRALKTHVLSRSASSPNLSSTPAWKAGPLPALPMALLPSQLLSSDCNFSGWPDSRFVEPIDTRFDQSHPSDRSDRSDGPDSPTSLPSLSPASSKSASFCTVSSGSHLQTPGLASSAFEPHPDVTTTPPHEPSYFPFGTPMTPITPQRTNTNKTVQTAQTPRTQTANNMAAFGIQPPPTDDVPLAVLRARRDQAKEKRVPFQFVPAEMSKKPLKKGRSTPNLRQPYRRPPSVASIEYYGHSLLPQSDEGVRQRTGPVEPLPPFVEQAVLSLRP